MSKEDFLLPNIDMLVDVNAKYSMFSFMNGSSGYNQIKMRLDELWKTLSVCLNSKVLKQPTDKGVSSHMKFFSIKARFTFGKDSALSGKNSTGM